MNYPSLNYESMIESLPPEWDSIRLDDVQNYINDTKRKLVVLDDDPTGVQTVQDIYVLTEWNQNLIKQAFQDPAPLFFILTNTRSMVAEEAARINREIIQNVLLTSQEEGYEVEFVSRSDSTLRGHYPLEINVLSDEWEKFYGKGLDGHLLVPAFFEGGRYTYKNVHYLKVDEELLPVHRTEFAKDKVFGFHNSDLRFWAAEKTEMNYRPEQCISISLEDIRKGPRVVEEKLLKASHNVPIIINAVSYYDLSVVSLALHRARQKGKRYIYRTAASFVKAYVGMKDYEYLSVDQLTAKGLESHGGLIVVGSHTEKTTKQLHLLLENTEVTPIEVSVIQILDPEIRLSSLAKMSIEINENIKQGRTVAIFSSRNLVSVEGKEENLKISQSVSSALVQLVQSLKISPRFMISKGGITSSDVATKGLQIKRAKVIGQATAGIPVWLTGQEAKFPNMPYIVFPGNVGNTNTLLEIVQKISGTPIESS